MSLRDSTGINAGDPTRPQPFEDMSPPDWVDRALCAQTDPEAYFPEKGGSTSAAKAMCARCEVRDKCLQWALDNDERHGIWGGLSDRERQRLARERRGEANPVDVRIWAKVNGVTCPPTGRIPDAVRAAFDADVEAA